MCPLYLDGPDSPVLCAHLRGLHRLLLLLMIRDIALVDTGLHIA
jgi:hypothetical protein